MSVSALICALFAVLQIVALREQNAHIQRKVASGEGGEDILEGSEAQQKVHGKVRLLNYKIQCDFSNVQYEWTPWLC